MFLYELQVKVLYSILYTENVDVASLTNTSYVRTSLAIYMTVRSKYADVRITKKSLEYVTTKLADVRRAVPLV